MPESRQNIGIVRPMRQLRSSRVAVKLQKTNYMTSLTTPYLIFIFLNSFLLMFEFQLVVPTAESYVTKLGVDQRYSGLLIGMNQFGTAILQLPILVLLAVVPIKKALLLLIVLMAVGNLLYSFALPVDSVAMLFVGRLLCSTTSGLQIGNSIIDMELDDPKVEYIATKFIAFVYQLGAVVAYILASFFLLVVTQSFASGTIVNAATICGYVSFGLCVCLLLAMVVLLPNKKLRKTASAPNTGSPVRALIGIVFIFLINVMEVLRQVTLFQLYNRRWKYNGLKEFAAMSLLASFIFVGILLTFPFDRLFNPTPTGILPAFVGCLLSYLLLIPYATNTTASILLQVFGGISFGFFIRSAFAYANFLVLRHIKMSKYPHLLLALNSMAMSCGIALGATCATLFELSPMPHVILLGLMTVLTPLILLFV